MQRTIFVKFVNFYNAGNMWSSPLDVSVFLPANTKQLSLKLKCLSNSSLMPTQLVNWLLINVQYIAIVMFCLISFLARLLKLDSIDKLLISIDWISSIEIKPGTCWRWSWATVAACCMQRVKGRLIKTKPPIDGHFCPVLGGFYCSKKWKLSSTGQNCQSFKVTP